MQLFRITFVLLLIGAGCAQEGPLTLQPPPDTETGPQQYGLPFEGVPDIVSIQLYEVNPRVFSASGDLDGITARLDSIRALGINVVWLMPIYPTGNERSVGSPYAVRNYQGIHQDYGTLTDLRALVDKAHELGMAVILDWVANHTAWDHPWINNRSWYEQDANGNIIHPPGTNWQDVAELNYDNPDLRQAMIRAMKYWILEANVDGYRCDYASGVPTDFWRQAIDTLRNIPDRDLILFAESDKKSLLNAGFDLLFGWPFYSSLKEVFRGKTAKQLYSAHLSEYSGLDSGKHIVRWITNHDEHAWEATPQETFGGEAAARAAFLIASYMGGVPLVYNGQEVATPYQLPFFAGNTTTINWNNQPEVKTEYARILNLRRESQALQTGALQDFSTDHVVAFQRTEGTNELLILVNVRAIPRNYQLPPPIANTNWNDAFDNAEVRLDATLSLKPFEYKVLKR